LSLVRNDGMLVRGHLYRIAPSTCSRGFENPAALRRRPRGRGKSAGRGLRGVADRVAGRKLGRGVGATQPTNTPRRSELSPQLEAHGRRARGGGARRDGNTRRDGGGSPPGGRVEGPRALAERARRSRARARAGLAAPPPRAGR